MCVPEINYESRSPSDVFRERFVDRSAFEVQVERENIGVNHKVTPLFNSKEFNLVRIQIVIPTTWPLTRSLTLPGAMVTIQVG